LLCRHNWWSVSRLHVRFGTVSHSLGWVGLEWFRTSRQQQTVCCRGEPFVVVTQLDRDCVKHWTAQKFTWWLHCTVLMWVHSSDQIQVRSISFNFGVFRGLGGLVVYPRCPMQPARSSSRLETLVLTNAQDWALLWLFFSKHSRGHRFVKITT
jgi:hypothetical protein